MIYSLAVQINKEFERIQFKQFYSQQLTSSQQMTYSDKPKLPEKLMFLPRKDHQKNIFPEFKSATLKRQYMCLKQLFLCQIDKHPTTDKPRTTRFEVGREEDTYFM